MKPKRKHRKIVHELCNEYNTTIGERVKVLEVTEHHFFDKGEIFVVTNITRHESGNVLLWGGFFGKSIFSNKCYKLKL